MTSLCRTSTQRTGWPAGSSVTSTTPKTSSRKRRCARCATFVPSSGGNGRAWFLRIVRNTCYGLRNHQPPAAIELFDEEQHTDVNATKDPETLMLDAANAELVDDAIRTLPDRFRELLVLRELKGLSYQELADVLDIPIGTVMSGLSRARQAFRRALLLELELRGMQSALATA